MSAIDEIFSPSAKYPELTQLMEETAKAMFPNNELSDKIEQAKTGDQVALVEYEDLLGQIIDACYSREPTLFGAIQWFNTDLGTPLWVKPGVNWIPDHELTKDELTKNMKVTIVSSKKTPSSIGEESIKALNRLQLSNG